MKFYRLEDKILLIDKTSSSYKEIVFILDSILCSMCSFRSECYHLVGSPIKLDIARRFYNRLKSGDNIDSVCRLYKCSMRLSGYLSLFRVSFIKFIISKDGESISIRY